MHRRFLALALVLGGPALAQNVIGENPALGAGGTSCGDYVGMDLTQRIEALTSAGPVGGAVAGAEREIAAQWADAVAAACADQPERLLSDAATQALGGN